MPVISSSACAKLILLGEHAVVYGEPALAVPFLGLRVRCVVEPWINGPSGMIQISARDLQINQTLQALPEDNFLRKAIELVLAELKVSRTPTCKLGIYSEIPISAGLGASAAIAVAIMRALSAFLGHPLERETLNRLAYETEKLMHGNPSGIDNTVIVYEQPVLFRKNEPIVFVHPGSTLHFLIADSGIKKATAETVAYLAQQRERDPESVDTTLAEIGKIALLGKKAFEQGDLAALGEAMNANQSLLAHLDLSCEALDELIAAARQAGALGAKLTGGGKGGNIIALVTPISQENVKEALLSAGALSVYLTSLKGMAAND
ncbi:MAG: Mevalonate kinase [Anaerolineae bacterium 49_20]|nr:MAG: Mevalonate kinase [Anaerolineae bacterium 49_20]